MTITDNTDNTYTIALTDVEAALFRRVVVDFNGPTFVSWLTGQLDGYNKFWKESAANEDLGNFRPRFDQLTSSQQAGIISILSTVPK